VQDGPGSMWPHQSCLGLCCSGLKLCVTYSEFMVEEHELRKEKIQEDYNDKYWDQRYTVLPQQIPSFLQKVAGKILSTGDCCLDLSKEAITAFQPLCP
jgi:hypothetical protein